MYLPGSLCLSLRVPFNRESAHSRVLKLSGQILLSELRKPSKNNHVHLLTLSRKGCARRILYQRPVVLPEHRRANFVVRFVWRSDLSQRPLTNLNCLQGGNLSMARLPLLLKISTGKQRVCQVNRKNKVCRLQGCGEH